MKQLLQRAAAAGTVAATTLATSVHAANNPFGSGGQAGQLLNQTAQNAGIQTTDGATALPKMIGQIINVVLGFMGIVLLFYVIWGGWEWMSSGDKADGAKAAKERIKNAVVGLIIIVSAYAISNFVISQLAQLTSS